MLNVMDYCDHEHNNIVTVLQFIVYTPKRGKPVIFNITN